MALDVGTITGAIVLRDAFNSVLDRATQGIDVFKRSAAETFPNVAKYAAALEPAFDVGSAAIMGATAAVSALATATFELANRGADIMDVASTLDHFSGSSQQASANLEGLRSGVKGTVDDMALMQDATRLLSANVKLNQDDFKTLGDAAFVLQNRGLGSTKEMLDLVSDAMITGRTRALAMRLGVVDAGNAAADFAAKLGVEESQLSKTGQAEATRIHIMDMLKSAVKDAGDQQKDFGEKVETGLAALHNWVDELSVAVTQSPVLTTMVDSLGEALGTAFGGKDQLISTVVHWIEQGLILTTDFGIATVEAARVVVTAWHAIEGAAYAVASGIGVVISAVAEGVADVTNFAASMPLATEGMKNAAKQATAFRDSVEETTNSLIDHTIEQGKAVLQQDEFNKTLDKVGGTLMNVRDNMLAAEKTAQLHTATTKENTAAQDENTRATNLNRDALIDQGKMRERQKKEIEATTQLWNEYNALLVEHSGTTTDKQIADIDRWYADQAAKAEAAGIATKGFYEALGAVSHEKLSGVLIDWDTIHNNSLATLQEQADKAKATYDFMTSHVTDFTRGALQEQLQKVRDTEFAASHMGQAMVENLKDTADKAKAAADAIDSITIATKKAQAEADAMRRQGGSFPVPDIVVTDANRKSLRARLDQLEALFQTFPGRRPGGSGPTGLSPSDEQGYRIMLAEQLEYEALKKAQAKYGFARGVQNFSGGNAWIGEQGPELVTLPPGTNVTPSSMINSGDNITLNATFYVNGTGRDVADAVSRELMTQLKLRRQFGGA